MKKPNLICAVKGHTPRTDNWALERAECECKICNVELAFDRKDGWITFEEAMRRL